MTPRHWRLLAVTALACWLAGGCSTLQSSGKGETRRASKGGLPAGNSRRTAEEAAQAHALYAAAVVQEMNNDREEALKGYYQAAMCDPGDEDLVLTVAGRLLQAKQPDRALEVLKASQAQPGSSGLIDARIGLIYFQLNRVDLAIEANRQAIAKSPAELAGYQNLFFLHLQAKEPAEALKVLGFADVQRTTDPEFLLGISELYATLGLQSAEHRKECNQQALDLLKRADVAQMDDPSLRLKLADGLSLLGESERAAEIYRGLLHDLPDIPLARERVHSKLADIYLRSNNKDRAKEQLEAIIREDPTNPQAYYFLGSLAYDARKPAEAADYFRKTVILNPHFEPAYYELASSLLAAEKPREALTVIEQARERFPENFISEFLRGMAFRQEKAFDDAVRHFTTAEVIARATEPRQLNASFFFQFGITYEQKRDFAQAEKYLLKSLELEADSPEVLNYLGYMWADRGEKLERAFELIQKAVDKEPENAAYLDSLGWVLFRMGRAAEALPHLEKALAKTEEPDAVVYDHLGDVFQALGREADAVKMWEEALKLEPTDAVRRKLEVLRSPQS